MSDDWDFKLLKRQILKDSGFDCSQYRDAYIRRRLAVRMRANNVKSYKDYILLLKRTPAEYDILLNTLTINVSDFFRDPPVFESFKKAIIPQLISDKKKKNQKIIRIWSAGCASGNEAYSIAMLLYDLLGVNMDDFIVSVIGTDIDDECLTKAKKGEYTPELVKNIRKDFLSRYFIFDGKKYRVNDKIKRFVKFLKHDLISDKMLTHFDVIFCRNVTIYFSKEMHEKLYMDFCNALNDDGFLVLGKTEMIIGAAKELFIPVDSNERIYQKSLKSMTAI